MVESGNFDRQEAVVIGEWLVVPSEGQLIRGEHSIRLQPRVMSVLLCLIEHQGLVVSKETLLDRVWEGRAVGDEAIQRCISQLRKIFEDDSRSPQYIETVPKRGYRLLQSWKFAGKQFPPGKCYDYDPIIENAQMPRAKRQHETRLSHKLGWTGLAIIFIFSAVFVIIDLSIYKNAHEIHSTKDLDNGQKMVDRAMRLYDRHERKSNETAIAILEKALIRNPRFTDAYLGLAAAYSQRYARWTRNPSDISNAITAALKAVQLDETDARAYKALGVARIYVGDYKGALRSFDRSLELNPDQWRVLSNIGTTYLRQQDYETAKIYFKRALEISPGNLHIFKGLGAANLEMGELNEAEKWYRRLLTAKSLNDYSSAKLATIYMMRGEHEKAKMQCEKVLNELNDDKYCSLVYGKILIAGKEYEKAYAHFRKRSKNDPKLVRQFETYQLIAEIRTGHRRNASRDILELLARAYNDNFLSDNDRREIKKALSREL